MTISAPLGLLPAVVPTATPRPLYLQPGQVFVTSGPATITTVLGSCVCACLWDPARQAGGANHFLLPEAPAGRPSARFGDAAMAELLQKLEAQGCSRRGLQAKLFGGASVIRSFERGNGRLGEKNVAVARCFLDAQQIPVVAEDVGGRRGRKLAFDTRTGVVSVRLL